MRQRAKSRDCRKPDPLPGAGGKLEVSEFHFRRNGGSSLSVHHLDWRMSWNCCRTDGIGDQCREYLFLYLSELGGSSFASTGVLGETWIINEPDRISV